MARTIGDIALMFRAIAGDDGADPAAAPVPLSSRDLLGEDRIRVGYFEWDGQVPVTAETRGAVRLAAKAVGDAGLVVEPVSIEGLERAREIWGLFFAQIGRLLLSETLGGREADLPILSAYARQFAPCPLTAAALVHAWLDRDVVRADILRQMEAHRVLICPVAAIPANRHGELSWTIDGQAVSCLDAMSYTQWFNILGNPAAVVPVGRSSEGLPIGVQVVGRPYEEELVLAVASEIERRCGGYQAPPIFN